MKKLTKLTKLIFTLGLGLTMANVSAALPLIVCDTTVSTRPLVADSNGCAPISSGTTVSSASLTATSNVALTLTSNSKVDIGAIDPNATWDLSVTTPTSTQSLDYIMDPANMSAILGATANTTPMDKQFYNLIVQDAVYNKNVNPLTGAKTHEPALISAGFQAAGGKEAAAYFVVENDFNIKSYTGPHALIELYPTSAALTASGLKDHFEMQMSGSIGAVSVVHNPITSQNKLTFEVNSTGAFAPSGATVRLRQYVSLTDFQGFFQNSSNQYIAESIIAVDYTPVF